MVLQEAMFHFHDYFRECIVYIYTVILYVHIVFAPAGAIVTIFQGEGTPNDHLLNTRSRVTNKGQSWKLTNALGVQTYSGFRVDGTGTQRCHLLNMGFPYII